jgi:putrescine transport system substrate-binding protein
VKKTDYKQNLLTGFLVIFVVTLGLSSCGTNEEETNIKQEVRVYNWSDYIADSTIREFEKETGIDVTYDVYDSNEILEGKLLSGNTGYDIVGPSSEFMGRQIIAGVYQKLNKDALYNYDNLDPAMMSLLENLDPDNAHSIPYLWGTTGIGYNKQKAIEVMGVDFAMNTLDVVFIPEIIAKFQHCGVAFLDAPSEMFKAALHYLGLNPNSQNPKDYQEQSTELFNNVRPYIQYFHSSKYINDLANGDICLAFAWSGDVLQAADRASESGNGVQIEYRIPKEGTLMWFDMLAIPADAPNPGNAHKFLNYILKPEVIAEISNKVNFANANIPSKSLIKADSLNNPDIYPEEDLMRKLFLAKILPPDIDRVMTRQWVDIKSQQ